MDAFTAEVIRSTVVAITDEMKTNLMRTAYNMIIYEAEDFTVGLFDADGNTISIGLGLPMFIRGLSDAIKAKLAHWGKENIFPGDILLTNDPQVMGSHLNHMIFTLPVFHDGELVAFSSSMGHWQDVGGVLGAVTRDVFSEGLQMPFVKIFKGGQQDQEITAIIRNNCRLPEFAMGDFRAQIAAVRTGERRLTQLLKRYGAEIFKQSVRLIFDQSEKLARAAVEKIPDGVYEAESFMDDDGVNLGKHIPIKVRVEVTGDEMTVDLTGVSPQVAGPYNSGATAGRSASEVAFKFLTTPLLLPINVGSFRPLKIVLPPGRIVSATKPAPVRTWMTVPMTVVDTIFKALAPALSRQRARRPPCRSGGAAYFRSRSKNRTSISFSPDAFRRRLGRAARSRRAERDFLHQRRRHPQHAGGSRRRQRTDFDFLSTDCARIPADQENFAAGWAWRKKCACSRQEAYCPPWSGRSARRGDCTAAKTPWPIASTLCVRTVRCRLCRPERLPAMWH